VRGVPNPAPKFLFVGVLLKCDLPHSIPNWEVKALEPDDTNRFGGGESRVRRHTKVLVRFILVRGAAEKHAPH
jgi:hypothetical protein